MADTQRTNGRDARGRFAHGNPGGPGNPALRRAAALQQAVRDAVTPKDLRAVLGKLVEQAKDGDHQAARIVLDRAVGKPREEREEATRWTFATPDLASAAGCAKGAGAVLKALARGEVDTDTALRVCSTIKAVSDTMATAELEQRLSALEGART